MDKFDKLVAAYIHKSKHPECDPEKLYRAQVASGGCSWHATEEEARAAILRSAGITGGVGK